MAKITGDTLLLDAVQAGNSDEIMKVLNEAGMHCFHCAFVRGETVADAALTHGLDVDELVEKLNVAAEK